MKISANNVWFTSDTHYKHANIVRGITNWRDENGEIPFNQVRDFDTLDEMDETMIRNINLHVNEDDWLIHLGDWSFGGYDRVEEFRNRINCKNIVLILGNHDHHIQRDKRLQNLFKHVTHYEEMSIEGIGKFVLCHYPIISWNGQHKGTYMLHGHQHNRGEKRITQTDRMDIGICGSPEFRPYHVDEIIHILNTKANEF